MSGLERHLCRIQVVYGNSAFYHGLWCSSQPRISGFGYEETVDDGAYIVDNLRVIKVTFSGKRARDASFDPRA
jgi:hypothetical protein